MLTHSEMVHVYYGAGGIMLGAAALWAWRHDTGLARYLWPMLLGLVGVSLLLPVETGERRYEVVGWWNTLVSVLPWSGREWLARVGQFYVLQHKMAGLAIFGTGVAELALIRRSAPSPWLEQMAPACSLVTGIVLGIHGGTHTHLPLLRETIHHWILGVALAAGGLTLGLYRAGRLRSALWRDAWAILMILTGLDWAMFYRIGQVHGP